MNRIFWLKFYLFSCLFSFIFICSSKIFAQERPKLVVGVVIDQMRYDYLHRYYAKYGDGGFKRLMKQGFLAKNMHYNYVPTETAPGHASVYTGTTPSKHGIVANNWYEKGKNMYCVGDSTQKVVGSLTGNGSISPKNLLVTTWTDELKIATQGRSKVIGISIKDRGAVLPAGHAGNGAFWYDYSSGKFISSTFYGQKLPSWVENYNNKKNPDKYLNSTWETLYPIEKYTESSPDDMPYEQKLGGKEKATFPYIMKDIVEKMKKQQLKKSPYELIPFTPYGNSMVKDLALEALTHEKLGKGQDTDALLISFSSPDIAGHFYGNHSVEIEDIYLRLDKDIEELLEILEKEIGEENYLLFLTADHAGLITPKHLQKMNIPADYANMKKIGEDLENYLKNKLGNEKWVEKADGRDIYLNKNLILQKNMSIAQVEQICVEYLRQTEGTHDVIIASELQTQDFSFPNFKHLYQNGFYHKRSPNIYIMPSSGWLEDWYIKGGTGHGSPYNYDTQVPLLMYGYKVPKGKSTISRLSITDIAPTICSFLNIQNPSGAIGNPIKEVLE
jgi:predicted AlkP superfamily pyrophosphatase or phosphodiesterase